jgi:hypothetical protein
MLYEFYPELLVNITLPRDHDIFLVLHKKGLSQTQFLLTQDLLSEHQRYMNTESKPYKIRYSTQNLELGIDEPRDL